MLVLVLGRRCYFPTLAFAAAAVPVFPEAVRRTGLDFDSTRIAARAVLGLRRLPRPNPGTAMDGCFGHCAYLARDLSSSWAPSSLPRLAGKQEWGVGNSQRGPGPVGSLSSRRRMSSTTLRVSPRKRK